jgi:hypothetical protein
MQPASGWIFCWYLAVTVDQFDVDIFGREYIDISDAGFWRLELLAKDGAFSSELFGRLIHVLNDKADMLHAPEWTLGRCRPGGFSAGVGDVEKRASELNADARFAIRIVQPEDLSVEHKLVISRGSLGIGAFEVNMVVFVFGHGSHFSA